MNIWNQLIIRYGLIQSVTSKRDIKAGEELLAYYGYEYGPIPGDFPEDYPWYFEAKAAHEKEERLAKEAAEKQKQTRKKKKRPSKKSNSGYTKHQSKNYGQ